jgi:hypothetical protein
MIDLTSISKGELVKYSLVKLNADLSAFITSLDVIGKKLTPELSDFLVIAVRSFLEKYLSKLSNSKEPLPYIGYTFNVGDGVFRISLSESLR